MRLDEGWVPMYALVWHPLFANVCLGLASIIRTRMIFGWGNFIRRRVDNFWTPSEQSIYMEG